MYIYIQHGYLHIITFVLWAWEHIYCVVYMKPSMKNRVGFSTFGDKYAWTSSSTKYASWYILESLPYNMASNVLPLKGYTSCMSCKVDNSVVDSMWGITTCTTHVCLYVLVLCACVFVCTYAFIRMSVRSCSCLNLTFRAYKRIVHIYYIDDECSIYNALTHKFTRILR